MNTSETRHHGVFPLACHTRKGALEHVLSAYFRHKEIPVVMAGPEMPTLQVKVSAATVVTEGRKRALKALTPALDEIVEGSDDFAGEGKEEAVQFARKAFGVLEKAIRCSRNLKGSVKLIEAQFRVVQASDATFALAGLPGMGSMVWHEGAYDGGLRPFRDEERLADEIALLNRTYCKAA